MRQLPNRKANGGAGEQTVTMLVAEHSAKSVSATIKSRP
jgi:hypothetical protein